MQVQIVFTASGCTSAAGNFAPGDRLRCSADLAAHLVNEAGCARYADAAPAAEPVPAATKTTKRQRGAKDDRA